VVYLAPTARRVSCTLLTGGTGA